MDDVNKTLYIPLYGKAYVSQKGILLDDKKAEEIWAAEGFPLKGKSKSKWLAYYMGMRSAVFDQWVRKILSERSGVVVVHVGCGLDSRCFRVGTTGQLWYDVDFADVIEERKRYYAEDSDYHMLAGDVRASDWLKHIPKTKEVIVVMEGVSMYLTFEELKLFMTNLDAYFERISLLMDCYTVFAAKMTKYRNPINDVGVTQVYGIGDPLSLQCGSLHFFKEHSMTPTHLIDALRGGDKIIFKKLYAGHLSKKLYRLYEFKKN